MKELQNKKLKQIASFILGIPTAFIAFSEPETEYWYVPFLAMGILVLILKWNKIINFKILGE